MTFQKLLIPFLTAAAGERAFRAGAVLAEHYKANLDVVHMRPRLAIPSAGSSYYPIAVAPVEEDMDALTAARDETARNLKKRFENLCEEYATEILNDSSEHDACRGATAAWSDLDASLPNDLAMRARVADGAVVARAEGKAAPFERSLAEELVFQSGRPVFAVSGETGLKTFPKTIMLAWDGGREAARALREAAPVLQDARTVIVATMGKLRWGAEPPESAAAFLRLHKVRATHLRGRPEKNEDSAEALLRHADGHDVDLIVMGAYSHNRWREVILGGFTRHMLHEAEIPVLMAH